MFSPRFKEGQKVWLVDGIGYNRTVLRYEGEKVVVSINCNRILGDPVTEVGDESMYTNEPQQEWN